MSGHVDPGVCPDMSAMRVVWTLLGGWSTGGSTTSSAAATSSGLCHATTCAEDRIPLSTRESTVERY